MSKRRFLVTVTQYIEIDIDQAVIDAVDDGWRKKFYKLNTPEDVAAHIGGNIACGERSLRALDGFADRKDSEIAIIDEEWDVEAEAIEPQKGTRKK